MNESENLWNADRLLKLSEDLQAENEQYRSLLAQKEIQIQTHLSDVQKLKSQIHSMQSTIAEQGQEIQKLNAHIARLAESDLVLEENEKLAEANRKLLAENEKAQNTFKEAVTKTEDAKRILAQAKALNDTFDKCVRDKVSHVKRNMEADMKGRLQTALQKQTVTLIGGYLGVCIYSALTLSIVLPPIPKFLSGNSFIVVAKNSCGTFIISEDTSVNLLINCSFCASVNTPLSIVMYGILLLPSNYDLIVS